MEKKNTKQNCSCGARAAGGDAVYGLGVVGAAIYYVSNAPNFWMVLLGILKALVWPAMLVYALLKSLGM